MAVLPISGANLSAYNTIHFDLYLGQAMTGDQQFQVNFATAGQDGYNTVFSMKDKGAGWYGVDIDMSEQTPVVASATWANINTLRFTWFNNAKSTTPAYFLIDNVYAYYIPDLKQSSQVLFDGESVDNVTGAFETQAVLYGVKTTGQTSMRMSFNDPYALKNDAKIGGMAMVNLPQSVDISGYDYLCYDLYLSNDMVGSSGFQVNLCTEGGDGYNTMATINDFKAGWNHVVVDLRNIAAAVSSADKTNINAVRFAWFNYDGCGLSHMLIDNVRVANEGAVAAPAAPYTPADLGTEFTAKINVTGGINLSVSGSNVIAANDGTDSAQIWKFVKQSDGSYEVLNTKTNALLDVTGAADAFGANVGVYGDMNSVAQRWFIYETANGYVFHPLCSGSCVLDVPTEASSANAVIDGYSGAASQLFNIIFA
jgi:hypothetical protein